MNSSLKAALLASTLIIASCGEQSGSNDAEPEGSIADRAADAAENAGDLVASKIRQYSEAMDDNLELIDEKIDVLKVRAENAADDTKAEIQTAIDDLEAKRDDFANQLDELGDESADAWDDVKSGLDSAWNELKASADTATERFAGDE